MTLIIAIILSMICYPVNSFAQDATEGFEVDQLYDMITSGNITNDSIKSINTYKSKQDDFSFITDDGGANAVPVRANSKRNTTARFTGSGVSLYASFHI